MKSLISVLMVLLALPCPLPAQAAPRQLSEEQLATLRRNMEKGKTLSAQAQQAAARRQEEARIAQAQDALAYDDEDWGDDEPLPSPGGGFADVLGTFTSTLSSEMAKKQQQDAQQQQFLDTVRRQAEAVDRQRQRDQERQRLAAERAQRERQAQQQQQARQVAQRQAAAGGVGTAATAVPPGSGSTAVNAAPGQLQAAPAREAALRANVAAERKRLADERERAAAADREQVMRPFVEASRRQPASSGTSAGTAMVSSAPKAGSAPVDHGPAKAWCQASNAGTYQCMGPLQNLLSWYPSLDVALSQAGCPGGEGYAPTQGHGGSSFNCGRPLKVNDYRMPTYDPYRGGGKPVRVKAGE